jgi:hypothetical protein
MRCEVLTRELATPTSSHRSAEMLEHLASCPKCAESARLASQFDRIWEATRPDEPSIDAMDTLWAHASLELDARKAPATLKFADPSRRRRWVKAAFLAAQAAAIVAAAMVLLRRNEVAQPTPVLVLNVETDESALVQIGGKGVGNRVVKHDHSHAYDSNSLAADTLHDEFGEGEMMASSWDLARSQ